MKQTQILYTDRKIESKEDSERWQFNFQFYNKLRSEAIMKIYNQVKQNNNDIQKNQS